MEDLYCQIFVDIDDSPDDLMKELQGFLGVAPRGNMLTTDVLSVDLEQNDDWDPSRFSPDTVGFVYSRYYLDVYRLPGVRRDRYIAEISGFLEHLWSKAAIAIAACDFEDELPCKAGLAR